MDSAKKFCTLEANKRIKIEKCIRSNEIPPRTIPRVFKEAVDKYGNKSALVFKDNGQQQKVTFVEYYHQVRTVAKAFLKLGLQRYHSVCILGANSAPWIYSNLAAIMAGGIANGIYASNSPEACLHCLKVGDANIVVVENDDQLQKILKVQNQAPKLKTIVQIEGTPKHDSVLSWEELIDIGSKESDETLDKIIETLTPDDCSSLLFTSGTTGPPKAVMLSHDNLIFKTEATEIHVQIKNENRRILCYLPLSHVAAQVFDLYKGLVAGVCIYIADDRALKDTIVENLRIARPTEFVAVPRIWEKLKEHIDIYTRTSHSIMQYNHKIFDDHLSDRYYNDQLCLKIKETIGLNECTMFTSGTAPISSDLKLFFSRLDMPISEVFGMTETSGGFISSVGLSSELSIHGCGRPMPTVKVKIHKPDANNTGELCVFGRQVFMGYLKDPQSTKAAFDEDGFFHTGDLACCGYDSLYTITGRIKELLITSGGENVSPVLIELEVKNELPIVSHAVVVGDGKKYLSLLITLKTNRNSETGLPTTEISSDFKYWYKYMDCDHKLISEILQHRPHKVYHAIQEAINRVNAKAISSAQRIQKFTILPTDFSATTGELSPTSKLLRNVIYEKYKSEIDRMYTN